MSKRFVSIWFRYFKTDWFTRRHHSLRDYPFVLVAAEHGKMIVTAANTLAEKEGVYTSMSLADARALIPSLQYFDDEPEHFAKSIRALAEWLIRFTPVVGIDATDGLMLDATGCAHLWLGEAPYVTAIYNRLKDFGYQVRIAMADTMGAAWAVARYGPDLFIVANGQQPAALLSLPSAALRLETAITERLEKLGLGQITQFINMPRTALRRRFGEQLLLRLDQALGHAEEVIQPVIPAEPFRERLPCIEPIITATGIEIALHQMLDTLCNRLKQEEKGLRVALFSCYRIDGKTEQIQIGTNRPSNNSIHLFKLFQLKIETIEPALGIELFILETPKVEALCTVQERLWNDAGGLQQVAVLELLDRIAGKIGAQQVYRFMPAEHYWPEHSFRLADPENEDAQPTWKVDRPRPLQLLRAPELIEVTAPIPDYPPMNFRYKGTIHKVVKADGPERIEQEWWIQEGQHRDYYCVEDEKGYRYWLFRLGHYDVNKTYKWFIHGFFA